MKNVTVSINVWIHEKQIAIQKKTDSEQTLTAGNQSFRYIH